MATKEYLENIRLREKDEDIFSSANLMLLDEENISRMYIEDYFKENNIYPDTFSKQRMDLLIVSKTGLAVSLRNL